MERIRHRFGAWWRWVLVYTITGSNPVHALPPQWWPSPSRKPCRSHRGSWNAVTSTEYMRDAPMEEFRVCKKCRQEKPIEQFKLARGYRMGKCKECFNSHAREQWRKRYRENEEFRKKVCRSSVKRRASKIKNDDEYRRRVNAKVAERERKRKTSDEYRLRVNKRAAERNRNRRNTDDEYRKRRNQEALNRSNILTKNLDDRYIKQILRLRVGNLYQRELIEVKRLQLMIKRLLEDRHEKHH